MFIHLILVYFVHLWYTYNQVIHNETNQEVMRANEVRKLIAQIAGVLFGIGGIILIIMGVKTTGKINIDVNIISGEIESASAGILLLFFSFFLIIIPALFGSKETIAKQEENKSESDIIHASISSDKQQLKKIFIGVPIGVVLTVVLFLSANWAKNAEHDTFSGFLTFGGFALGIVTGFVIVISLIWFITDYGNIPEDKENQKDKD